MPLVPWRAEAKPFLQAIKEFGRGGLRNANRSIALNIGVSPHRTKPRSRSPNIAAQESQICKLLNVLSAATVLSDAHAMNEDRAPRLHVDASGGPELIAAKARAPLDSLPVLRG